MAADIPDYQVGSQGVNIVATPLHTPDGGLLTAQNVEFIREFGIGGIGTRRGIAKLTGSSQLAGDVQALINAPFPLYAEKDLMVALNAGETPTWKKSTDGTTFTNLTSATLQRMADGFSSLWGTATIPRDSRPASFRNQFYYIGSNYTVNTTSPPVVVFNGTQSFEQFRVPSNPTSSGVPRWISDFVIFDGIIYLGIYDPSGVAPDQKGRVLSYDPSNGLLLQIGNRFGQESGENTAGFPFCLTSYLGYLWAGTYGVSGNNQGKVYRIQPGVDSTWTLDLTGTLHNGYYMSLCPYNGKLYAATDADSSGTAIIQSRAADGTWSTSLSAPASNVAFFCSLIVFNNELYAGYYNPNGTPTTLIKKYDGSSWTTDKNVGVDIAALVPGKPFIFLNELYWPFYDITNASALTGFLLKRTTGGVWSTKLSNTGIIGGLGQFIPPPT